MSKSIKNAANFVERKYSAMYTKIDIWQSRTARLLFMLMCCAMPMFLSPQRYVSLPLHKWNFFIFSMVTVLILVIVIWIWRLTRKPMILPQVGLNDFNLTDWAIIGFGLVTIITSLASPYSPETIAMSDGLFEFSTWVGVPGGLGRFDGAITQLLYIAIFFIISRWYRPREKDFMWLGLAAIAISLIGIIQFYGFNIFGLWPNNLPQHRVDNFFFIHIRTTLGNTNTVSVFVTLIVLFFGFLFIRKKSKWQPLWLITSALSFWMWDIANADSGTVGIAAAMLLCIPFIIQTLKTLGRTLIFASTLLAVYTLQTFLFEVITVPLYENLPIAARDASTLLPFAAAFVLLLAIGLILNRIGKEPDPDAPPKWKLGVILIVVSIIIGIAGIEVMGRPDADGGGSGILYEAREVLHGNIQDEFGTNRIFIWRNALSVFPNNPIIGTGPDTFRFAFPAEAHEVFETYDNAHNEYINYLITHGILGLLAYLIFVMSIIVFSVRKAFHDPVIMAFMAAFAGYLAQAFFNISHPIASQMLWVFAGVLMCRRLSKDGLGEN